MVPKAGWLAGALGPLAPFAGDLLPWLVLTYYQHCSRI